MKRKSLLSILGAAFLLLTANFAFADATTSTPYSSHVVAGTAVQSFNAKALGASNGVDIQVVNASGHRIYITDPFSNRRLIDVNSTLHITNPSFIKYTRVTLLDNYFYTIYRDSYVCNYAVVTVLSDNSVAYSSSFCSY